jgi:hypothetical protein
MPGFVVTVGEVVVANVEVREGVDVWASLRCEVAGPGELDLELDLTESSPDQGMSWGTVKLGVGQRLVVEVVEDAAWDVPELLPVREEGDVEMVFNVPPELTMEVWEAVRAVLERHGAST